MKVDHNVELLAPAGSYEAFEAALGAGADAVYVGGPEFGARAYAHNFTQDELLQAIDTVHIHGKKLYLTVNTLLKKVPGTLTNSLDGIPVFLLAPYTSRKLPEEMAHKNDTTAMTTIYLPFQYRLNLTLLSGDCMPFGNQ